MKRVNVNHLIRVIRNGVANSHLNFINKKKCGTLGRVIKFRTILARILTVDSLLFFSLKKLWFSCKWCRVAGRWPTASAREWWSSWWWDRYHSEAHALTVHTAPRGIYIWTVGW